MIQNPVVGFVWTFRLAITVCGQIRFLAVFVIRPRSGLQLHRLTAAAYCFITTRAAALTCQGLN